jgi:hypothetical protein
MLRACSSGDHGLRLIKRLNLSYPPSCYIDGTYGTVPHVDITHAEL